MGVKPSPKANIKQELNVHTGQSTHTKTWKALS